MCNRIMSMIRQTGLVMRPARPKQRPIEVSRQKFVTGRDLGGASVSNNCSAMADAANARFVENGYRTLPVTWMQQWQMRLVQLSICESGVELADVTGKAGGLWRWLAAPLLMAQLALPVRADAPAMDVLVLGDSQITFGLAPPLLSFFEMPVAHCAAYWPQGTRVDLPDEPTVGVIGVRSTSLGSWISRTDRGKSALCDVDKRWRANAGSYGVLNSSENPYVQIGRDRNLDFCESGQSAFETMFQHEQYMPRLLVLSFLGNGAERWASDPAAALADVQSTMAQLPADLPCIFMTTTPVYHERTAVLRSRAQDNIVAAFRQAGSRCSIVQGHTPETLALNVGNPRHFRQRSSGAVRDPYHPTREAQQAAVNLLTGAICGALAEQLR
jgi:hypothetical protein